MKGADAYVPDSFDDLPETMSEPYAQLVEEGEITATLEGKTPQAPMDCRPRRMGERTEHER